MRESALAVDRAFGAGELAELTKNGHPSKDIAVRVALRSHPADVVLDVSPGGVGHNAINGGRPNEIALQHDNLQSVVGREIDRKRSINHALPAQARNCEATFPCTCTWEHDVRVDEGVDQAPGGGAHARWPVHL